MNKREYTFRLKNICLKMIVPDKVSALIHAYNIHTIMYTGMLWVIHSKYLSTEVVYKYVSIIIYFIYYFIDNT